MIFFLFKGVAVTILDDGIEKDHPDLIRNYDPLASETFFIYNLQFLQFYNFLGLYRY